VNGKGSKEREVYFTTECKVWLKRYMQIRILKEIVDKANSANINGHIL
jgi:site-specific recombinase XerC